MNIAPKCKDCGQPMFLVGEIKEQVEKLDFGGEIVKVYATIYQCPECKVVALG